MKTIVLATDYSEDARNATEYAARIAAQTGATLVLFHAFFLPEPLAEAPEMLAAVPELTQAHLIKLESLGKEITKTYGVQTSCYAGPVPVIDQLTTLVKREHANLVVLGIRGTNAWERNRFGSTTAAVLRMAHFPLLAVPEEAHFQSIQRILFACNTEAMDRENHLAILKEIALAYNAHVQVLHLEVPEPATEAPHSSKKHINLEAMFTGVKHEYLFAEAQKVIKGIENGVQEFQADLLVMVPHRQGFWDIAMNRSNTRKIAFRTHIPLLVLPNPA